MGVTPELSIAVGSCHVTLPEVEPAGISALMLSGQNVTCGGVVSMGSATNTMYKCLVTEYRFFFHL